jgi:hypothetical protein
VQSKHEKENDDDDDEYSEEEKEKEKCYSNDMGQEWQIKTKWEGNDGLKETCSMIRSLYGLPRL